MRLLLVDDEIRALRFLERILHRLYPDAELLSADNYKTALELAEQHIDVAFLDVEMPGMNGMELGEKLQTMYQNHLNIIYVTAYEEYAREAYHLHASGYLTKPYDREEIENEMKNLRYPIDEFGSLEYLSAGIVKLKPEETEGKDRLVIRCFGSFEVFYDNRPVHFERRDSKEILAFLIDRRGASASRRDICTALWEDADLIERRKTYFRTLILSLKKTLQKYNAEELLISHRDSYAVNMDECDCDYYNYLNRKNGCENSFRGEYMSQYTWSENTMGQLTDYQ